MSQSTIARPAPTTPVDLAPITVEHPEWCGTDCRTTVARDGIRETVHSVDLVEVELRGARIAWADGVCDLAAGGGGVDEEHPGGWTGRSVAVALVKFDEWAADGTHTRSAKTDIVLDGPEGVLSLTPRETIELAAALLRAYTLAR